MMFILLQCFDREGVKVDLRRSQCFLTEESGGFANLDFAICSEEWDFRGCVCEAVELRVESSVIADGARVFNGLLCSGF